MIKDLTKGSPMKLILSFGIPLLFGYLFQQLYNVVDTAIVGKTLGGAALASVGATGSINFLVVGFCAGVCGGFAIPWPSSSARGTTGSCGGMSPAARGCASSSARSSPPPPSSSAGTSSPP